MCCVTLISCSWIHLSSVFFPPFVWLFIFSLSHYVNHKFLSRCAHCAVWFAKLNQTQRNPQKKLRRVHLLTFVYLQNLCLTLCYTYRHSNCMCSISQFSILPLYSYRAHISLYIPSNFVGPLFLCLCLSLSISPYLCRCL